jgi:uncharacterized membrane protein YhaH (DUF805 family)
MTLIELGCLGAWLIVPCFVGAFVAGERGGWNSGLPAAAVTFVALPIALLLASSVEMAVRRFRARRRSKGP